MATLTRVCVLAGHVASAKASPTAMITRFIGHLRPNLFESAVPEGGGSPTCSAGEGYGMWGGGSSAAECHFRRSHCTDLPSIAPGYGCLDGAAGSIRRITSPGSACRPTAFLEKTRRPSTSTSNTPPED